VVVDVAEVDPLPLTDHRVVIAGQAVEHLPQRAEGPPQPEDAADQLGTGAAEDGRLDVVDLLVEVIDDRHGGRIGMPRHFGRDSA
jgi:hypothetical protein